MGKPNPTRGYGVFEGFLARRRAGMATKLIPQELKGGRILDIGCSAHPLFLMSTDFSEKYGLDKLIREAHIDNYRAQKIILNNYDIEKDKAIPFETDYFNVVIMLAVFEHIDPLRLVGLLSEIHRVLRPGGRFVMTTPAQWTDWLLKLLALLRLVSPDEIKEHQDAYDFQRITSALVEADFSPEKIRCGYFELGMNIWTAATK